MYVRLQKYIIIIPFEWMLIRILKNEKPQSSGSLKNYYPQVLLGYNSRWLYENEYMDANSRSQRNEKKNINKMVYDFYPKGRKKCIKKQRGKKNHNTQHKKTGFFGEQ